MLDRRRYKRLRMDAMDINCQMMFVNNVNILNMSIYGASLKTNGRLNIGSVYALGLANKNKNLTLEGMAVWSHVLLSKTSKEPRSDFIPVYTAGVRFTDVSKEKVNEIVVFIEEHKQERDKGVDLYKPNGLRHNVRVHIDAPEKAILNFFEGCKVKELSFGGMLIQSRHELENESRLSIKIILPGNKPLNLVGKVVSCRFIHDIEPEQVFDMRIEFIDISEENTERLKEFIRSLNVQNSAKNL